MILWLLLYIFEAQAQDPVIEEYCFASEQRMRQVTTKLQIILVPADKVMMDKNCLTINTPPHRRELIQSYVRNIDPTARIGFSSAEIKRDPCRIKVEKIKNILKETTGAQATGSQGNPGTINIYANTADLKRTGSDVTQIQTLKEFELAVNQDVIKGECRFISPTRYEISLEVRKDAKPLTPPVPPGTIVVIPAARVPDNQETSKLQTTLQLNQGERIEIGSVVKNLRNQNKITDGSVSSDSGAAINAGIENSDGVESEKVFLSIQ